MEFEKSVDYGNTPEFYVDGISAIEHNENVVRIEYYATYRAVDGTAERRLVLIIRWPIDAWLATPCFRETKARLRGAIDVPTITMQLQ